MRDTRSVERVGEDEVTRESARSRINIQDVHERLADLVLGGPADEVVDLVAGQGGTLVEVARRSPRSRLTAVDLAADALAALSTRLPQARALRHDLAQPLPLEDGSVDVVLSYNTLECLLDPPALLTDIARVLTPGGRAVLGHTDFETIVVTTADRDLTRRVLRTYAELLFCIDTWPPLTPRWVDACPGWSDAAHYSWTRSAPTRRWCRPCPRRRLPGSQKWRPPCAAARAAGSAMSPSPSSRSGPANCRLPKPAGTSCSVKPHTSSPPTEPASPSDPSRSGKDNRAADQRKPRRVMMEVGESLRRCAHHEHAGTR